MARNAEVSVTAPNFETAEFTIRGIAPYVQNKFSAKAQQQMKETQEAGHQSRKGKQRAAKDFQACYEAAQRRSKQGWHGIAAPSFRNAMISACRLVGFKMTLAKLSVFVEADGFDADDGMPLVKITKGKPRYFELPSRNANGNPDIHPRPMWDPGWEAKLRVRWDADQFGLDDVTNLLVRVGMQIGIGEGRPDSKNSAGLSWGLFDVLGKPNGRRRT